MYLSKNPADHAAIVSISQGRARGRRQRSGMVGLVAGLFAVFLGWGFSPTTLNAAEKLYSEDFERNDSPLVGNGWREILSGGDCIAVDEAMSPVDNTKLFFAENDPMGKESVNPLQRELAQEVVDARREKIKSTILPESTAEIQDGHLFLHFQENQASQIVQRDIDKRVTRLSFDFTPLYAMGGVDDRAWLGVRLYFLDHRERILGEIRYIHYNVFFDEYENSDTIHSIGSQGPFDGSVRHATIDAETILEKHLTGVEPERVAKTRLSIEISSNICGSTVEGYVDNIVAKFGRHKLSTWLNEIPREVASKPASLAKLMAELYALDGKNAFVVAYGVSILLYHF